MSLSLYLSLSPAPPPISRKFAHFLYRRVETLIYNDCCFIFFFCARATAFYINNFVFSLFQVSARNFHLPYSGAGNFTRRAYKN